MKEDIDYDRLQPMTTPRPERRHVSEGGFEGPISAVWDEATVAWLGAACVGQLNAWCELAFRA